MNLNDAVIGETYTVKEIRTDDEELSYFSFASAVTAGTDHGGFTSESGCVVSIKDGRYNIDNGIAEAILI